MPEYDVVLPEGTSFTAGGLVYTLLKNRDANSEYIPVKITFNPMQVTLFDVPPPRNRFEREVEIK